MCGLFAYAGQPGPDPAILRAVAEAAGTRGPHGWGVLVVAEGARWEERSLRPLLRELDHLRVGQANLVLGHARLATVGGGSALREQDYQPILLGDIAIAHNGTVAALEGILQREAIQLMTGNDSEVLAHLMARRNVEGGRLLTMLREMNTAPQAAITVDLIGGRIFAATTGQPLHVLTTPEGVYLCSRALPGSSRLEGQWEGVF